MNENKKPKPAGTLQLTIADFSLEAHLNDDNTKWSGTAKDELSGKIQDFEMSPEEFAATMFLVLRGDDDPDDSMNRQMYQIAESAVVGWPRECRPFP